MAHTPKSYTHAEAPVLGALPVSAQALDGKVHIVLGNGRYAALPARVPQDPTELEALTAAINAQPLEPTTSGSGREYHKLIIGTPQKIGGKGSKLALVSILAGVDGPVVAYALLDLALAPEVPELPADPDDDEDEDEDDDQADDVDEDE